MKKPWLLLPPHWAHDLGPFGLKFFALMKSQPTPVWRSFTWNNLTFKNPLGLAGGVDKNAESLKEWWDLGVGFAEIGTVTPRPQKPNPGKIMDRDLPHRALWNKMGFPSAGAEDVYYNLRSLAERKTPVFVNIGKNRETPNEAAVEDYLKLIERLRSQADAFVVNISSPNTKGLRDLQNKEALAKLLEPLVRSCHQNEFSKPILLKLSPDLNDDSLEEALQVAVETGIDGFVLTNTTLSRPQGISFPAEGGLSGAPLKPLSCQILQKSLQILGKNRQGKLIVSAGGIMTPEDVFERLQMGADLVEIYSALIFEGPGFFQEVARKYFK